MIYLDNSATTRPFDEVVTRVAECLREEWFNPSAGYREGISCHKKLETERANLAGLLGCRPGELCFTASGTEADNLAIFGSAKFKNGRYITTEAEHPAVFQCFCELKNRGYDVQFVRLKEDSSLDLQHLASLLTPNTKLVSVMHVQNETGAVYPLAQISAMIHQISPDCLFHSDGVQAFCKVPVNLAKLGVDLYTVSSHKVHGPKGVGALFIREGIHLSPVNFGGGQEKGIRSGTENFPDIAGFTLAAARSEQHRKTGALKRQKELLKQNLLKIGGDLCFPAENGPTSDGILSVSFGGIKAEVLQQMASQRGLAVGKGSACSTHRKSRILEAMRLPAHYAEGTLRLSLGHLNTDQDCVEAAKILGNCAEELRNFFK